MATYEVILPKLGQTVEESRIVEWLVDEGDAVDRGDVLFTIETDKATLDVEAPKRGFLRKILAPAGEVYPVLTVVGYITRKADEPLEVSGGPSPVGSVDDTSAAPEVETTAETPSPNLKSGRIFASPRARKFAREHEVDIALVTGTGPNGRIVEKDVQAYLEALPDATPVARRLAVHLGVDLRALSGSGPGGRITKADVESARKREGEKAEKRESEKARERESEKAKKRESEEARERESEEARERESEKARRRESEKARRRESEEARGREGEKARKRQGAEVVTVPVTGVRAIIAERMHTSHAVTAPVTLTTEVDAMAFAELREKLKVRFAKELGFNISYNALLMMMAAKALQAFPEVNARLVDGEGDAPAVIHQLAEIHVSLAMDTGRGLIVPVVRDVDRKGLLDIARDVNDLILRTRAGKIMPDELVGGTFTVTNLGMFEIDAFTPIINLPEAAILGVGRIKETPVVRDGEICIRKMMWMSLTFDHRLVDGGPAARFLQYIKHLVEEPYLLIV